MKLIDKLNQFETYYLDDDRITLTSYEVKGCRKAETDELRILNAFDNASIIYINTDVFKRSINFLNMSDYCVKLDLHERKNYLTLNTSSDTSNCKLQIPLLDNNNYGEMFIDVYAHKNYAYSLIHIKEYMKHNKSNEMCVAISNKGLLLLICDNTFMILAPRIDI